MKNSELIHILYVYYEPFPSGQTTHVLSLARGLDKERFVLHIFLPETLNSVANQFEQTGAEVILTRFQKTHWSINAIIGLTRWIKANPDAIIHFHSQEAGLIGRIVAKLAGAKHIFYTPQTIDIRKKNLQKIYSYIEYILGKFTDIIVSVNEADRGRLISWGIPRNKTITIYNGIDLEALNDGFDRKTARSVLEIKPDCPLVMQIGRMSAQKAPFDFIEGATKVLKNRQDVQFVMIGDGPLLSNIKQKVRDLGVEGNIKITGAIENAHRLIPAADILTLTSFWEGTPYSILEAMGYAKAVVVTNVNGCPEIVEDGKNGLLVTPGDTEKWAHSVLELVNSPEKLDNLGLNGKSMLESRFTIQSMTHTLEHLYIGIVNGQRIG